MSEQTAEQRLLEQRFQESRRMLGEAVDRLMECERDHDGSFIEAVHNFLRNTADT